jgi:hypothetical protein
MNHRYLGVVLGGLAVLSFGTLSSVAAADWWDDDHDRGDEHRHGDHKSHSRATGLVKEVLEGTRQFRDFTAAEAQGWMSAGSCVSGPDLGAMGIHFVNGGLLFDGTLDPQRPEALIYEPKGRNRLRLVGAEFIVIADSWHAANTTPPVLLGQHFNYVGTPNRYGLPAFYELHVWAWRHNSNGMFVDWNPRVSCEEFAP